MELDQRRHDPSVQGEPPYQRCYELSLTDKTLVQRLWQHNLQPSNRTYQDLHRALDSPDLLPTETRSFLLGHAIHQYSKHNFLHHLLFYRHLQLLSPSKDLASQDPWQMSRIDADIHRFFGIQRVLGYRHVLGSDMETIPAADVYGSEIGYLGDLCYRVLVSQQHCFTQSTKSANSCPFSHHRAIVFAIIRLIFNILLMHKNDYSYAILQGMLLTVGETSCGIICSCLFVLPRLYRHLTSTPPHKSEEYQLRKYKHLVSSRHVDEAHLKDVKREQEGRNPWDRDIERVPVV